MAFTIDLSGRAAVVTGGNRGLGASFAWALADAGARVGIIARDDARNAEFVTASAERGIAIVAVTADITDALQAESAADELHRRLGGTDILVNNAGTAVHSPALDTDDDDWDRTFDLNVRAMWKMSALVGRRMIEQRRGAIVNIGSMSGFIVNRPQQQAAYNASKAAVHHLTRSLAVEWAPHGVRVNAVAPGYVKTEMAPVDEPEFRRYWIDDVPQQRYALPEEIAPSVVFLASDAASFITGSVLVADGGYTTV